MVRTFPYLLLPHVLVVAQPRAAAASAATCCAPAVFGGIGLGVCAALFGGVVLADRAARRSTRSSATTCCASGCRGCS